MCRGDHHGRRADVPVSRRVRLERGFYARDTVSVARELLGQQLVRILDGQRLSGRIVETEAYVQGDEACHATRGKTNRTEVMFGPPGHAYVYFIYGMHHCLNAVTEREGFAGAVLIRALEPLEGLQTMHARRNGRPERQLTNGPGKLCQALAVGREMNGVDLVRSEVVFIEADARVDDKVVLTTPRINVRGDELALTFPWRFVIGDSPFRSR